MNDEDIKLSERVRSIPQLSTVYIPNTHWSTFKIFILVFILAILFLNISKRWDFL